MPVAPPRPSTAAPVVPPLTPPLNPPATAATAAPLAPSAPVAQTPLAPPRSPTPAATEGKRPINPFLANDPNAKAKRLARALISDLVVYHPQRREEGLKQGTLKQLFDEEIRKSYEEYVDQLGKDFAESTTHFTDALNEILANGQKVF